MTFKPKNILLIALTAIVLNTFLWLDSLDTYLSAQYHVALSEYLPESIFQPSIKLKKAIAQLNVKPAVQEPEVEIKPTQSVGSNKVKPQNKVQPQEKLDSNNPGLLNAKVRILFAGDSMMQGIAPIAISSLRKMQPDAYFEDLSKQSTGLTVNRFLDWPATIKEQINQKHFNIVAIFLGPNDPWDIVEGKQKFKFPSAEWEEKYRSRVKEVLDFAAAHQVQVIWIGLPNMREERLHTGAVVQNKVFRQEMNSFGFKYISTEDLLGELDQPFKNSIVDSNGKEVVVRASDGTHFTPQGLRIIASKLVSVITGLQIK
jgi:hypothetical protein